MTFASKLDEDTPQTVWEEQEALGGRILLTIPFGASVGEMKGFISVIGKYDYDVAPFPVLTLCVEKPAGGAIVSTIVFPTSDLYISFVDRLHSDTYSYFERSVALIEN